MYSVSQSHTSPGCHASSDPISVLEQAVGIQQRLQSSQDHEVQNAKLKETLEEYKSEFAQVKNQGKVISTLGLLHRATFGGRGGSAAWQKVVCVIYLL